MKLVYLDNSATTKVHPQVVEAMVKCFNEDYGNPSSLHGLGLNGEKQVNYSRRKIAQLLGCQAKEVIFTSGGSESNNMAITGVANYYAQRGKHIITTKIEHASVLAPIEELEKQGWQVTYLDVDHLGRISMDQLDKALTSKTILVSIMLVNNELGAVQPTAEISKLIKAKAPNAIFHVDGVQGVGVLPLDLGKLGTDLFSFSGHKFYGPKGVGGLYIRQGVNLKPLIYGGGQEFARRSGTENVPGIAGMAKALTVVWPDKAGLSQGMRGLQQMLWQGISEGIPQSKLNSDLISGAPHIVNISFPGVKGEVLLHYLESEGIYVSTGSACSAKSRNISHVLAGIGLSEKEAEGTIRYSFGMETNEADIAYAVEKTVAGVKELLQVMGR